MKKERLEYNQYDMLTSIAPFNETIKFRLYEESLQISDVLN
jgi:hypothetical protein